MELRRRLGEVLDRASAGERIVIERGRRPLAVLVPYEDAQRLEEGSAESVKRSLAALDELDRFAARMAGEHADLAALPDAAVLIREEREGAHRP
jgi:prevent-host-death family protein